MKERRYSDACPKLEASERLDPSYGTLMNLGDCYRQVGRTASAWGAYREAADLARKYSEPNRVRQAARLTARRDRTMTRP